MKSKIIAFSVVFLIGCIGLLVFKSVKSPLVVDIAGDEKLALDWGNVEYDEDGEIEETGAEIVQEDEIDRGDEIDPVAHHFSLTIETGDLKIQSPVVHGVSLGSLSRGVGRHISTATPNSESGNVVLSGHQWFPGDKPAHTVFEDLDQLEIGQEVEVKYGGEIFTYKVRSSKIVEPTDVSILEQTENPQLTLYTCYPRNTTEKRLVYTADLIDTRSL